MDSKDIYYRRNLPHIHPDGYPIFITFNLTESIPKGVVAALISQRDQELKNVPLRSNEYYKIQKKYFGKYDEWLDKCEFGHQWLRKENISKKIHLVASERYELVTFCIMPNHVHLLINSFTEKTAALQGKAAKYHWQIH